MLKIDARHNTVGLRVSTNCLQHVYAQFEGRLELTLVPGETGSEGDQLDGDLHLVSPEGYSPEFHVAGDMAASELTLEMQLTATRSLQ